ncbi:LCP family protein [Patescibacteria group bacterium]
MFLLFGFIGLLFFKTGFTISQVIENGGEATILPYGRDLPKLPEQDINRTNILLLGMRGVGDPGEGVLLSDTIILLSFDKTSNKASLISIPRDLYVEIWGLWETKKINSAYAYGGFDSVKKTVSLVTGQYIDYVVNVNFNAVTKLIDNLGGINVYLSSPFEESIQWANDGKEGSMYWVKRKIDFENTTTTEDEIEEEIIENDDGDEDEEEYVESGEKWVFYVPAGTNAFDGSSALYYARSRFSSNDFDRMRRQQDIIMAIRKKAFSLGILTNPVKIYNILDLLGKNVRTDISLGDMKDAIKLFSELDINNIDIKKEIFDANEQDGLLYEDFINGEYVLLPIGDNFKEIQEVCKNILD